jgi:hypothetical protein
MKFKVGDRVEVIAATMSICGEIGTISDVRFLSKNGNGPIVMVTLDRNHEDRGGFMKIRLNLFQQMAFRG